MSMTNKLLIDDLKYVYNNLQNNEEPYKQGIIHLNIHNQLDCIKSYLLNDLISIIKEYINEKVSFEYKIICKTDMINKKYIRLYIHSTEKNTKIYENYIHSVWLEIYNIYPKSDNIFIIL
jgi:hypothetical protein